MIMRLTMARMANYHWDKFPSVQKFAKANYNQAYFQKVNELVIKIVESGAGNLSQVLSG